MSGRIISRIIYEIKRNFFGKKHLKKGNYWTSRWFKCQRDASLVYQSLQKRTIIFFIWFILSDWPSLNCDSHYWEKKNMIRFTTFSNLPLIKDMYNKKRWEKFHKPDKYVLSKIIFYSRLIVSSCESDLFHLLSSA